MKRAQLLKIKAQLSSIWAKAVCVFYLTLHDYPSLGAGRKSWYIIIIICQ